MKTKNLMQLLPLLVVAVAMLFFTSCTETEDIQARVNIGPVDFIEINGKVYKLAKIQPCAGCYDLWILFPKDTSVKQPMVINSLVPAGKSRRMQTVIKVD